MKQTKPQQSLMGGELFAELEAGVACVEEHHMARVTFEETYAISLSCEGSLHVGMLLLHQS